MESLIHQKRPAIVPLEFYWKSKQHRRRFLPPSTGVLLRMPPRVSPIKNLETTSVLSMKLSEKELRQARSSLLAYKKIFRRLVRNWQATGAEIDRVLEEVNARLAEKGTGAEG